MTSHLPLRPGANHYLANTDTLDISQGQVGKLCTETNTYVVGAGVGELEFEAEENELTLTVDDLNGDWAIFVPSAAGDAAGGAAGGADGGAAGDGTEVATPTASAGAGTGTEVATPAASADAGAGTEVAAPDASMGAGTEVTTGGAAQCTG